MLAQYHSAGAHHSAQQNHQTEPPDGVEVEYQAEREQPASHSSYGCRVGRHLPPHVGHGAEHLHGEGRNEYRGDGMGRVAQTQDVEADEVAEYRDDVGHHSALAYTQLNGCPAMIAAVEMYQSRGQQHREEPHYAHHHEDVVERKGVEIAEEEECRQPHQWQIERCEHHAHNARDQYYVLFFHFAW